ncbi:MAG TPA: putative sulfate exporter family transporter, partial [Clostridiaceae bacterium]|nr:putative sulfate exporter family transporter [Clostridiaceae bacterium]
ILVFLAVVALKSTGILSSALVSRVSLASKFAMVMALSAIGLKTSFRDVARSGFKPMVLGFTIDTLVVIVSLGVQVLSGRI